MLDAGVAREIQNSLAVLLEGLPRQDLREEVRGVVLGIDARDGDNASATQLAHLNRGGNGDFGMVST